MSRGLRGLVAGLLVFFGLLVFPLANLGIWTQRQVLDTGAFNDLSLSVLDEPAVRDALALRLVEEIVRAEPRLGPARVVLEPGVNQLLQTDVFRVVFSNAVGQMHTQLEQGADELSLDLDGVLPLLRNAVGAVDTGAAGLIPSAAALPAITVVSRDDVPELWEGVQITREASWAFPVVGLALFAAAVAIANRRARMLIVIGVGVAVLGFVQVLLVRLGRDVLSDVTGRTANVGAFTRGYDVVTESFVVQTVVLSVLGIVMALAAGALLIVRQRNERPATWA